MLTPSERKIIGSLGGHTGWSHTEDRTKRTEKPRQAFEETFFTQVDPDNVLPPDERAKRAANARAAYYQRLALKSVQARRRAKEAREQAAAEVRNGGTA